MTGFVEQQIARRTRAELLVGAGLLGQLTLDAFEIGRARIDLLLVFQADVLLLIALAADLKGQRLRARDLNLLLAGFDRQWNADDGDPAPTVLAHHQHRFALIARLRRLGLFRQGDHGHATGYRFVQQAGEKALGLGRAGRGTAAGRQAGA